MIDEFIKQCTQVNSVDELRVSIPKDWTQGRTVFGGLSAALLHQAMRSVTSEERILRSISYNFVGPIEQNTECRFVVTPLREGKNASQVLAHMMQGDNICLTALATFAVSRESKINVPLTASHKLELPKKANFIPQIPKITPKFLRHVDLAIQEGKLPFTGSKQSHFKGWMKLKQQPQAICLSHIIALIDAWPPTILQMARGPAPASTMSWQIEFYHPEVEISPNQWLGYEADTLYAADGYGHSEADIWTESGALLAKSRQLIAIFDK